MSIWSIGQGPKTPDFTVKFYFAFVDATEPIVAQNCCLSLRKIALYYL